MTIPFDPQHDFAEVVDAAESVTLLRPNRSPGEPGTVVAHALHRPVSIQETAFSNRSNVRRHVDSDAQAQAADVVWHLPQEELPAAPQLGDVILDAAGHRWTILEVRDATLHSRWQCTARELAIAKGLDDTITILQAEFTKSQAGAAEANVAHLAHRRAGPDSTPRRRDQRGTRLAGRNRAVPGFVGRKFRLGSHLPHPRTRRLAIPNYLGRRRPRLGELQTLEVVKCS